jgi:hypothetical protein
LDAFLASNYQSFRQAHAATAGLEWSFTLCALLGAVLVLLALFTLRPHSDADSALSPSQRQARDLACAHRATSKPPG